MLQSLAVYVSAEDFNLGNVTEAIQSTLVKCDVLLVFLGFLEDHAFGSQSNFTRPKCLITFPFFLCSWI